MYVIVMNTGFEFSACMKKLTLTGNSFNSTPPPHVIHSCLPRRPTLQRSATFQYCATHSCWLPPADSRTCLNSSVSSHTNTCTYI